MSEFVIYNFETPMNDFTALATTQVEAVVPRITFETYSTKKNQYISNISNHYIVHCKYLTF